MVPRFDLGGGLCTAAFDSQDDAGAEAFGAGGGLFTAEGAGAWLRAGCTTAVRAGDEEATLGMICGAGITVARAMAGAGAGRSRGTAVGAGAGSGLGGVRYPRMRACRSDSGSELR